LTDETDKEPAPPTADPAMELLTAPTPMFGFCRETVPVTPPELVPVSVVVLVTVRCSLGAALRPDVAKLTESEPDAPMAEPETEPPVPPLIVAAVMVPLLLIVPLLVAALLIDATVHVPFGAVWAMADDAEISADVISSANREVLFKVIFITSVEIIT
jgi:hypothetical protein